MSVVVKDCEMVIVEERRGKSRLLEEPLDVDDTLPVIPVCELTENVLG